MISKILDFLNENPWLNLFSLGLGILGIVVSILLFVASKKEKIPIYDITSFNLINDNVSKLDGVKVMFNNIEIENLTTSVLAIWNQGGQVINRNDVAPADPVRIEVQPNQTILSIEVLCENEKSNRFRIQSINASSILVEFDYFHKNQGIVIRLYHTGVSSDDVKILGTIKGAGQFKCIRGDEFDLLSRLTKLVDRITTKLETAGTVPILFVFIIVIPLWLTFSLIGIVKYLFKPIPKEFRKLENFGDRRG